jgi:hypothetical protein
MPLFGAVEHTPATPGPIPPPIVTVEAAPRRPVVDRIERLQNMVGEPLNARTRHVIENEVHGLANERYRIDRGSHGNVKQIDEKGSIIRSFCIQPEGVPAGDVLLTQKLWLEASDETRNKFWETANITEMMKEKAVPHHIPRHERRRYAEANGLLH